MNITVLCGGVSSEREISLRSSVNISQALRELGNKVVMMDVFFGEEQKPSFDNEQDFEKKADELRQKNRLITKKLIAATGLMGRNVLETCMDSDIVFLGLHGENGEDGKIQAVLDRHGIKYTGSNAKGSAIAMSKARTKEIVSPHIMMPKGTVIKKGSAYEIPGFPCVLKPDNGGSSVGVMIVRKEDEFDQALKECFEYSDTVICEVFIDGRELTQGVLEGRALPPVEICPDADTWYDYRNKYNGLTTEVCPAPISDEVLKKMSEYSIKFGELLGLEVYYRIDYLLDKEGKLYALEANTLPGMTNTSLIPQEAKAIGISFNGLCSRIIEASLKKYPRIEKLHK